MKIPRTAVLPIVCCAFLLLPASLPAQETVSIHAGHKGPLYSHAEKGKEMVQSPVDILTGSVGTKSHALLFQFDKAEAGDAQNTGHSVQVNFSVAGDSTGFDGEKFQLKQAHFHTPSEHLLDGVTYPMELHIVHVSQEEGKGPQYLVMGFFFKAGKSSKFIDEFLKDVPHAEGKKALEAHQVVLNDIFGGAMPSPRDFYFYRGSLTTPPYTEAVRWCVCSVVLEASEEQIQAINEIEGNNARHQQALHDRKVEKSE